VKTIQLYLLSLLSGLLLAFAWFPSGFTPLIFIAFIPLLMVEQFIYNEKPHKSSTVFIHSYIAFFTWNAITTWWIKNASIEGAAMAILCNTLLMAGVFQLFHNTKKRIGEKYGNLIFICFWITFEWLHLDWDLTYPWLTLGNVFAADNRWVQWYEYTGVFGGSLWVLVLNVLISQKLKGKRQKKDIASIQQTGSTKKNWILDYIRLTIIILGPLLISFILLSKEYNYPNKINVVVVQPNIDPYNEKFSGNYLEQLQKMISLTEGKINDSTDYLIFPETALTEEIWENELDKSTSIQFLQAFLKHYPQLKIIIGAASYRAYNGNERPTETARKFYDANQYYDAYNTAIQLDSSGHVQIYHKSKLVPGVEKMPFPFIFKYMEDYAINLGGTTGSLAEQTERTAFYSPDKKTKTAPVICYESIYGEFVGEYIHNGAEFISIITNDGWWGDTPGYKQHLKYGALRAIETRKWIARSANTGISCFINPKGEIMQATSWWVPASIAQTIGLSDYKTFYTTYGDYIARIAFYASLCILIYSLLLRFGIIKK
jgi:apolipoprotein N-acyltransferase